jgi:prephenate dehydrogenase
MTAQAHDQIFAAVSHLPHLRAFALVNNLANRKNAKQLFDFAAQADLETSHASQAVHLRCGSTLA